MRRRPPSKYLLIQGFCSGSPDIALTSTTMGRMRRTGCLGSHPKKLHLASLALASSPAMGSPRDPSSLTGPLWGGPSIISPLGPAAVYLSLACGSIVSATTAPLQDALFLLNVALQHVRPPAADPLADGLHRFARIWPEGAPPRQNRSHARTRHPFFLPCLDSLMGEGGNRLLLAQLDLLYESMCVPVITLSQITPSLAHQMLALN